MRMEIKLSPDEVAKLIETYIEKDFNKNLKALSVSHSITNKTIGYYKSESQSYEYDGAIIIVEGE